MSPPRPALLALAAMALFAAGYGVGSGRGPERMEQHTVTVERVRLQQVLKVEERIVTVHDERRAGRWEGTRTTLPDGAVVERGVLTWDSTARTEEHRQLALNLSTTAAVERKTEETKIATAPGHPLTLGVGAGGPFAIVPLHFEPSVALLVVYRVGELFKLPVSVWGLASLQPPTFVPNAVFVGVAVSF